MIKLRKALIAVSHQKHSLHRTSYQEGSYKEITPQYTLDGLIQVFATSYNQ